MLVPDAIVDPRFPRPLSRREWDRMARAGELEGERIELVRGAVVRMSPLTPLHDRVTDWLSNTLARQLGATFRVASGGALAAGDDSEPQPDVMVVTADWTLREHRSDPQLVIEVSVSSLRFDLGAKLELYAESGVPEYWVVDAEAATIHVHTEPDRAARRFARTLTLRDGDVLRPTRLPDVAIAVADVPMTR